MQLQLTFFNYFWNSLFFILSKMYVKCDNWRRISKSMYCKQDQVDTITRQCVIATSVSKIAKLCCQKLCD